MKQITVIFRAALLIAVLGSLAACSGGTFEDPGHWAERGGINGGSGNYSGGGGGGNSKPSYLTNDASFNDAVKKLDEIISYCKKHPGNETIQSEVAMYRNNVEYYRDIWSYGGQNYIVLINNAIDQLK